jgi:hypothetical protein
MMTELLLTGLLLTQAPTPPPATPSAPASSPAVPVLGELHAAQVDAHLSRLRALQAEIALQQKLLQEQRAKIDATIAATFPGYRLDWDAGTLVPVSPAPKKETP